MLNDKPSKRAKVCHVTPLESTLERAQAKTVCFPDAIPSVNDQLLTRLAPEHAPLQTINEFFKKYLPHKSPVNSKSLALSEYCDSEVVNIVISHKHNGL